MSKSPDLQQILGRIRAVAEAPDENFADLLRLGHLDPEKDLRFNNWSDASFAGLDLRRMDFTGARLVNCDFEGALIGGARFDRAILGWAGDDRAKRTDLRRAADWGEFAASWKPSPNRSDAHLRPGMIFQDGPNAPVMVVVPPGKFLMGSEAWRPTEYNGSPQPGGPIHEVEISRPFAVSEERHAKFSEHEPLGSSWDDAREFVQTLVTETGQPYGLLSESEWEYCRRNEVAFGLLQMTSDRGEWCHDVWHDTYEGAPSDGFPRLGVDDQHRCVVRGIAPDPASRSCLTSTANGPSFRLARVLRS